MFAETIYYNNRQDELIKEAEQYRLLASLQKESPMDLIAKLIALFLIR